VNESPTERIPPCLLCQETNSTLWAVTRDVEYFSLEGDFSFYHCQDCGVLYVDPLPNDRLAEIYPENYYSFTHALDSPVYRVKQWLDARLLRGLLRSLPGESLRALDIGGGTGWQLSLLQQLDERVGTSQVVDIDSNAEEGAQKLGHNYFHGRIENFVTEEKFDIILMLNLIEHVEDPIGILQQAERLLTPGGIVLLKTPNFDSLDARLFRHAHWSGYHCPRHWVLFNRESFEKAAKTAGLQMKECRYTQGAPFWSGSTLNFLSTRGIIQVSKEKPMLSSPLSTPLFAIFAAFDFLRMPFMKTSQMFIVLQKNPDSDSP
jgi:2-polyprenyl-3-methyl-5-hydroxy-6-metoxy-1,4-benzoquinol methylase